MPNWKAPGSDRVQNFWLKNFKSIQEGIQSIQKSIQKCSENGNMSIWMTKEEQY